MLLISVDSGQLPLQAGEGSRSPQLSRLVVRNLTTPGWLPLSALSNLPAEYHGGEKRPNMNETPEAPGPGVAAAGPLTLHILLDSLLSVRLLISMNLRHS